VKPGEFASSIRQWAQELGFCACGFAKAKSIDPAPYRDWVSRTAVNGLDYLARHMDLRCSPKKFFPGGKTVISLAMSYAPDPAQAPPAADWVALYARGRDYHKTLKQRAKKLCDRIGEQVFDFNPRVCVDTAPVAERYWAKASGVGWVGRNGLLIVPGRGSMVLLAEIVCNLTLPADAPLEGDDVGDCASCGRCVKACPTGALDREGDFQPARCLSYHTIENRGEIPPDIASAMTCQLYGCDLCQRVCPFNCDVPPGEAELRSDATMPTAEEVAEWTEADWDAFTCGKALRRAKLNQWTRNAKILLANREAKQ
jgi:epoxyqueuosine reductase